MVGIVIVSHSQKLAEGVAELARMMAENVPIRAAGGMDDGSLGTSFDKISQAIDEVYSEDGVAVLMDMGSSVMTTEMVMEDMEGKKIKMLDCPLVEGTVLVAVESIGGTSLEEMEQKIGEARTMRKLPD